MSHKDIKHNRIWIKGEIVIGGDSLIKGWNLTLDFSDIEFVYEKARIFKLIKRRIKDSSLNLQLKIT